MTTRTFLPTDLDACIRLFISTFAQPPWSETWEEITARERLYQLTRTPGFHGAIMEDDKGEIAAFALGVSQPWPGGNHFYIQEVCVTPQHQRQGLGTTLMAHLSESVEQQGNTRIYLLTARGDMAEAFYTKLGFYTSPRMVMMARRFEK